MANAIEKAVLELTEELAEKQGVYVVDVSYKKENGERFLRFFLDKPGGVGIDDCEAFSRAAETLLDEKDLIPEAYLLEVSSPGVDRKLRTEREFVWYLGREVEVKLYRAADGKKEFSGILSEYQNETAWIESEGKTIKVPVKEAVYIRLYFKM